MTVCTQTPSQFPQWALLIDLSGQLVNVYVPIGESFNEK